MSAGSGGEEGDFTFQIAPMVDVVFVLLLFFMACAGQSIKEGFLPISLPVRSGTDPASIPVETYIDIDPSGNVFANSIPMSTGPKDRELAQLRAHLANAMRNSDEDPVVVRPAPEVRHERVVDVLQACRSSSVKKLTFR